MDLVKQILLRCMVEGSGKQGFPYKHASEGDSVFLGGGISEALFPSGVFFWRLLKINGKKQKLRGRDPK